MAIEERPYYSGCYSALARASRRSPSRRKHPVHSNIVENVEMESKLYTNDFTPHILYAGER